MYRLGNSQSGGPAWAFAAAALSLASATGASAQPAAVNDPLEPLNRRFYAVHKGVDRVLLRPAMVVYLQIPRPLRSGLRNAVENLGEPVTFVNDVLQVRPRAAGRTLTRFATNSTLGVAGVFNLADRAGFPRHYSDFGQTLGRYGVGTGPFLFIPGLGPSTLRDLGGRVVDSSIDPVNMVHYEGDTAVRIARPAVTALEARAFFDLEIRELDRTAIDPYVALRSAYLQNRQSVIRGPEGDVDALPSFTPEASAAEVPAAAPSPN